MNKNLRNKRFVILCNSEERRLIAAIAKRMDRTQGDAIRLLIKGAAHQLNLDLQGIGHEAMQLGLGE